MEYTATVGEGDPRTIKVLDDGSIEVDGKAMKLDLSRLGAGKYHLIHNNRSFTIHIISNEKKKWVMEVNGRRLEVDVKDRFDNLLTQLGMERSDGGAVKALTAPMPGLVLDVQVKPGDEIANGEPLLVLQAMKMENVLKSTADVVVKEVLVAPEQSVDKNAVLITFE